MNIVFKITEEGSHAKKYILNPSWPAVNATMCIVYHLMTNGTKNEWTLFFCDDWVKDY